jgi:hypothetical protein
MAHGGDDTFLTNGSADLFGDAGKDIADRAHQRLLDLLAGLDVRANADRRLAGINRVAGCDLWH